MEEKVLIESTCLGAKKTMKVIIILLIILGVIASLGIFMYRMYMEVDNYNWCLDYYEEHKGQYCAEKWDTGTKCFPCQEIIKHPTLLGFAFARATEPTLYNREAFGKYYLIPWAVVTPIVIICLLLHSCELTVTDKRVYGKVFWLKRVDLPIDSISSSALIPLLKGVSISTSSGNISLIALKNAKEIHDVISNLLIDRQSIKASAPTDVSTASTDVVDQLKKYKELLDDGIITQEEFDAKKKQLLNL